MSDNTVTHNNGAMRSTSKLLQMRAQFQQKQMVEKEQRQLELLDSQQERVMQKAGLRSVVPKTTKTTTAGYASRNAPFSSSTPTQQPGKVREMFEERRRGPSQTQTQGNDRGHPLNNLRSRSSSNDPLQKPNFLRTNPVPSRQSSMNQVNNSTTRGASSRGTASPPNATSSRGSSLSRVGSRGFSTVTPPNGGTPSRTSPDENGNSYERISNTTKYTDSFQFDKEAAKLSTRMRDSVVIGAGSLQRKPPPPASRKSSVQASFVKRTPQPGLTECAICGRCFASDRIDKHEAICKKTANKKRKVFDPTKMRMSGTEAEPYLRTVKAEIKTKKVDVPKKVDWRKQHEDFIRTIRAAKEYQKHVDAGGNPADLPPPPPSDNSDYIQCPHCKRKFNQAAAERHIPKCQSMRFNKR